MVACHTTLFVPSTVCVCVSVRSSVFPRWFWLFWIPLQFLVNFRISLPNLPKKPPVILVETGKSTHYFGPFCHLNIGCVTLDGIMSFSGFSSGYQYQSPVPLGCLLPCVRLITDLKVCSCVSVLL